PIVVDVADGQAASNHRLAAKRGIRSRDIAKRSTLVREHLVALRVGRPECVNAGRYRTTCFPAFYATINEREVKVPVQVEVLQDSAETGTTPSLLYEADPF